MNTTNEAAQQILTVLESIRELESAVKLRDQSAAKFELAAKALNDLTVKMSEIPDSISGQCRNADDAVEKIAKAFDAGGSISVQLQEIQKAVADLQAQSIEDGKTALQKLKGLHDQIKDLDGRSRSLSKSISTNHDELLEVNNAMMERIEECLKVNTKLTEDLKSARAKIDSIQATVTKGFFKRLFG